MSRGNFKLNSREFSVAIPLGGGRIEVELQIVTAYVIAVLSFQLLRVVHLIFDHDASRGAVRDENIVETEIAFPIRKQVVSPAVRWFLATIPRRL